MQSKQHLRCQDINITKIACNQPATRFGQEKADEAEPQWATTLCGGINVITQTR